MIVTHNQNKKLYNGVIFGTYYMNSIFLYVSVRMIETAFIFNCFHCHNLVSILKGLYQVINKDYHFEIYIFFAKCIMIYISPNKKLIDTIKYASSNPCIFL